MSATVLDDGLLYATTNENTKHSRMLTLKYVSPYYIHIFTSIVYSLGHDFSTDQQTISKISKTISIYSIVWLILNVEG